MQLRTSPDRSQPPVGAYAVWKDHQRHADLISKVGLSAIEKCTSGGLEIAAMVNFADGNRNGLLEWAVTRVRLSR